MITLDDDNDDDGVCRQCSFITCCSRNSDLISTINDSRSDDGRGSFQNSVGGGGGGSHGVALVAGHLAGDAVGGARSGAVVSSRRRWTS